MDMQKSIHACYEEIKQREIKELKAAVERNGNREFDKGMGPVVMCNLKYYGPTDVQITSVSLDNGQLVVIGSIPYGDVEEIPLSDIAYGHIEFITSEI